ncbi:MAG: aminoacyl-histidine dipeptidase [Saprospiraceae bacterium]|nr:aminoacyl-histidine dipeptidase [Saprospiraceae bacterium]
MKIYILNVMNDEIRKFNPERLWHYFAEILEVPRPSKKEEKIAQYLLNFGKSLNLETIQDEIGNVLIRKPASAGCENLKSVVLQSHIDMVCEKNSDTDFDFENDTIQTFVEDGWVKAKGTTLGADDGIGVATQLAILADNTLNHGPIECLFTVDEETGLTGAFGLKPDLLNSEILINLDSEDEGELFIGCAGGKDTLADIEFTKDEVPNEHAFYRISITGLKGGHSGDEIQKRLGNANKLLNRILWDASKKYSIRLNNFDGGNLRNAIAREAFAVVAVPNEFSSKFEKLVDDYYKTFTDELHKTEPDLKVSISIVDNYKYVIDLKTQNNLLNAIYSCPHGVIAWSADIENFVETSTNLASVKMNDSIIKITTSQRSSVESAKYDICNMVASVFILAGAKVVHTDGYPGWKPNPDSEIMEITKASYQKLFNKQPKVLAIHAGLECGLIGETYPKMDMISFGPTIKGAHSPDERLKIDTVKMFWDLTIDVLKNIPTK